jgi:AcrR family transcriptional regulator
MSDFGKRALNKARTRLNILDAVYRLSGEVNFRDLKVKTIADDIGITEMTFFNYFQKKEDILQYMMGVWTLDLMVLQHKQPLTGEMAIRRMFNHVAKFVNQHPRLMANFVASLLTTEVDPTANDVEAADRYLLHPDAPELYEVTLESGNDILMKHLGEIDATQDHTNTLLNLVSCFYGDMIISETAGMDIGMLYSNSLDLILKNVKQLD